jgi:hypothetical protein
VLVDFLGCYGVFFTWVEGITFFGYYFFSTGGFDYPCVASMGLRRVWGILRVTGISYFFLAGEVSFYFNITCPDELYILGTTTFSAKLKSGTTLFLFSTASYPSPLLPQFTSKYLLNHWMNSRLS